MKKQKVERQTDGTTVITSSLNGVEYKQEIRFKTIEGIMFAVITITNTKTGEVKYSVENVENYIEKALYGK